LDIQSGQWSDELCALYRVPRALLPQVKPCDARFGETDVSLFGASIPITGMAGDQQAALVGQACLERGMAKATYGTGLFLVMNMGAAAPRSNHRLLATIGYQTQMARAYALEGSIFSAGATMQWLRDGLKAIASSAESEAMAAALPDNGGVYLVPAFAGLGAPHWDAEARGAVLGLTRDSSVAHIVRAGLEAVAYQTRDLLDALAGDGAPKLQMLLVDGGLTANGWAMQFLADITETEIVCPAISEATALGAAKLAALGAGLLPDLGAAPKAAIKAAWIPRMKAEERERLLSGWRAALKGVLAAH
jgi:glycerol kinase